MAENSKIVIEINLGEGCFTSPRTTGLHEVSRYLPEVVLPSGRYSNVPGRNNKCVGGKKNPVEISIGMLFLHDCTHYLGDWWLYLAEDNDWSPRGLI